MNGVSPDGNEVLAIVDVASRWNLDLQDAESFLKEVGYLA